MSSILAKEEKSKAIIHRRKEKVACCTETLNEGYSNFQPAHCLINTLNQVMIMILLLESHIKDRLHSCQVKMSRVKTFVHFHSLACKVRKGPAKQPSFSRVHFRKKKKTFLRLLTFSIAHACWPLCAPYRTMLQEQIQFKGLCQDSVFLLPSPNYAHNHCMRLCVVLRQCILYPFNIHLFLSSLFVRTLS